MKKWRKGKAAGDASFIQSALDKVKNEISSMATVSLCAIFAPLAFRHYNALLFLVY